MASAEPVNQTPPSAEAVPEPVGQATDTETYEAPGAAEPTLESAGAEAATAEPPVAETSTEAATTESQNVAATEPATLAESPESKADADRNLA